MQSPEEYLRQRSASSAPSTSSASQIAVFVVSFLVVCLGLYLARTSTPDQEQATFITSDVGSDDLSDSDLVKSMESLVKSDDPMIIAGLRTISEFTDQDISARSKGIQDLSSNLETFTRSVESYSRSLLALENADASLKSVQSQAKAIEKSYVEKKSELGRAAPQLLSDLAELKKKQTTLNAAITELRESEQLQSEMANDLKRSQNRITELEAAAEAAYSSWRNHVEQKLKPSKETAEYSADLLSKRLQEAKSSSGKISVLRRELQTHSVILTESATKIAGLSHQKTILESRLKSIDQLGHDLNRKFGTNTDASLENAINKQKLRLATVKSEYSTLPDEEPTKVNVNGAISDEISANLPGYKKKLMQIAVDEAERKLVWLQELQTISRRHGREDSDSDEVKEEALRSFVDLKKSEISKELASIESELDSERRWQERIVSELNQKNEQLKVLEHDLSSDAIANLRTQAERAKAVYQETETESKALERIYLEASRKFQDVQSESSGLHERLMSQKERVRQLNESNASLVRSIDLLRKRISASATENRSVVEEISQIRSRVDQLQQSFDAFKQQYGDAAKQLQSDETQIRTQLKHVCKIIE